MYISIQKAEYLSKVPMVVLALVIGIFTAFYASGAQAQTADPMSWTMYPEGLRNLVNARGYNIPNNSAFHFDDVTARKVCQILGYNRVVSMDSKYPEKHAHSGFRDGWYSPHDNQLSRWTGSGFETARANHMGNIWISSLTCADRIGAPTPTPVPTAAQCANGTDDDGDGKIDAADSSCHTDFNPANAPSYNASINDEGRGGSGTCNDSRDNNGNGLIDGADPLCHTDGNANNPASFDGNRNEGTAATPAPVNNVTTETEQKITVVVASEEEKDEKNNIEFSMSDDRETVKQGEVLTYKLRVRNNRDNDITNVKIVDRLPSYLIPLATQPASRADAKSRTITWDKQTISANSEVTFALRVRVGTDAPNGFLLQNSAIVNGDGIRASATDTTLIQGVAQQVAGASIAPISAVPVSAKTGLPIDTFSILLSLSGSVATAGTLIAKRFI